MRARIQEAVDGALQRLFEARFRLGMFDPPEMVPYSRISMAVNDCAEHRQLALQAEPERLDDDWPDTGGIKDIIQNGGE